MCGWVLRLYTFPWQRYDFDSARNDSAFLTLTFADADAGADIAGIIQMGSMAPTTGGKAITLKKEKGTGEEKEEEKNNTDARCFPQANITG